jgi:hypothetical protein
VKVGRFVPDGARLKDGTVIEAELPEHKNQPYVTRLYLGDEVADRIGPLVIRTI